MRIQVTAVYIPAGSTIGIGRGFPEGDETKLVVFGGDWRPMAGLAMMAMAAEAEGEPLVVDIPDWTVLEIRELP